MADGIWRPVKLTRPRTTDVRQSASAGAASMLGRRPLASKEGDMALVVSQAAYTKVRLMTPDAKVLLRTLALIDLPM